jgi:hypothetical protein
VEALRWRGATEGFAAWAARIADKRLLARCTAAAERSAS